MSNTDVDQTETDRADEYDPNPRERGKWISALIAVLGLWMIAQAALVDLVATQFWNDVAIGLLLLAVGGYNYYRRSDEKLGNMAAAVLAALLGLWLVAAPFVLGADTGATEAANEIGFWNDIVVGLLALGLGAYSAYKIRDWSADTHRTTT